MMVLDMQQKTVVDDITQFADHATEASLQRCFYKKVFWKYAENLQENTHADVDFSKNAKQLYWNHTTARVFACKFTAYFQNTISQEHIWRAASKVWIRLVSQLLDHISRVLQKLSFAPLWPVWPVIFLNLNNSLVFISVKWVWEMVCYTCWRGWRGWRVCVSGVVAWVTSMVCLHRWRARVGSVLAWVAWVACFRGWHASALAWVAWVACLRGRRTNLVYVVDMLAWYRHGSEGDMVDVLVWVRWLMC